MIELLFWTLALLLFIVVIGGTYIREQGKDITELELKSKTDKEYIGILKNRTWLLWWLLDEDLEEITKLKTERTDLKQKLWYARERRIPSHSVPIQFR